LCSRNSLQTALLPSSCAIFWGSITVYRLIYHHLKKNHISLLPRIFRTHNNIYFSSITNVLWHQNPLDLCWRSLQSKRFRVTWCYKVCHKVDFESCEWLIVYSCVVIFGCRAK
jgi:hypothetical protein